MNDPDDTPDSATVSILAWLLCGAFFGALGYGLYLAPGWGDVFVWIVGILS